MIQHENIATKANFIACETMLTIRKWDILASDLKTSEHGRPLLRKKTPCFFYAGKNSVHLTQATYKQEGKQMWC